jgi:transcriptional regulator with XRE-family HTH domain
MAISGAQSRAARALLDWSQDDLAKNASVARATIADFERGLRLDMMRQNMVSLITTMEAAGVTFLPESDEGEGAGVRFRKLELEYTRDARLQDGGLVFSLRYRGSPHRLRVPREALDDLGELRMASDGERIRVAQDHLGRIMRTAELKLERGEYNDDGTVLLTSTDLV